MVLGVLMEGYAILYGFDLGVGRRGEPPYEALRWTGIRERAIVALPVYKLPHRSAHFRSTRKFTRRDDQLGLQKSADVNY